MKRIFVFLMAMMILVSAAVPVHARAAVDVTDIETFLLQYGFTYSADVDEIAGYKYGVIATADHASQYFYFFGLEKKPIELLSEDPLSIKFEDGSIFTYDYTQVTMYYTDANSKLLKYKTSGKIWSFNFYACNVDFSGMSGFVDLRSDDVVLKVDYEFSGENFESYHIELFGSDTSDGEFVSIGTSDTYTEAGSGSCEFSDLTSGYY